MQSPCVTSPDHPLSQFDKPAFWEFVTKYTTTSDSALLSLQPSNGLAPVASTSGSVRLFPPRAPCGGSYPAAVHVGSRHVPPMYRFCATVAKSTDKRFGIEVRSMRDARALDGDSMLTFVVHKMRGDREVGRIARPKSSLGL